MLNLKEVTDEKTVKDLESKIDPTDFRTVSNYLLSKDTEIEMIFSVDKRENLAHVAAIMTGATKTINMDIEFMMYGMLREKIIRKVLPDDKFPKDFKRSKSIVFSEIDPMQLCWVIICPPAYIIFMDGDKKYQ